MSDGHKLAQLMRQAGRQPQNEVVDIVLGEVTSISPLKVKVENRVLTQSFLIVGALCKETYVPSSYVTGLDHYHNVSSMTTEQAGDPSHSHTVAAKSTGSAVDLGVRIMLWRGLQVGDRVLMLKVGRGQKYYIMQRQEGVTAT